MKKRCVIVGGAEIRCYEPLRRELRETDFLIYCDSGLRHEEGLQQSASLIVGDFDSWKNPERAVETIILPTVKDDTDTVYAVKEGLKRGYETFLLLGVIGGRLDHTLGNVYLLEYLFNQGKTGRILDDYSELELVGEQPVCIDDSFAYFSLLNITGMARGINITGAKYPLAGAEIASDYQYGVSNEVLPGETAEVSVKEGKLLLVKVREG